jgi:nicotinamidase-related amidase
MKKILIVVDMQNDFIDGALGSPMAEAIVDNVAKKIHEYSDNNDIILFTKDTHYSSDYLVTEEGRNLPVKHCILGTHGWMIKDGLLEQVDACKKHNSWVVRKPTFGAEDLIKVLRYKVSDITNSDNEDGSGFTVELVGLCTDICVISNAVIAKTALPNAHIVVDAACCAGVTPESHDTAIKAMQAIMVEVLNYGEEPWRKASEE